MIKNVYFGLCLLSVLGCASPGPAEIAALDMEIERAILWDFRNEARFDSIEVTCRKCVVVLQGTVSTMKDAQEALERAEKAAQSWDSDAEVVSKLRDR